MSIMGHDNTQHSTPQSKDKIKTRSDLHAVFKRHYEHQGKVNDIFFFNPFPDNYHLKHLILMFFFSQTSVIIFLVICGSFSFVVKSFLNSADIRQQKETYILKLLCFTFGSP